MKTPQPRTFVGATQYLGTGGKAKARAYVKRRFKDACELRAALIDGATDGQDVVLYTGAVTVKYDMLATHPWEVITPTMDGYLHYPCTHEVQVIAYILARFW